MIRQTSIEIYRQIESEGLLNKLRWETYKALFHYGPATQHELCRIMKSEAQDRSIMPRFAELEKMGVIYITQERPCKITGRIVYEYDVTNNLPIKIKKQKKFKCKHCNGKGYFEESQAELF